MKCILCLIVTVFLLGQYMRGVRCSENSTCNIEIDGCSYRVALFPTETCTRTTENSKQHTWYAERQQRNQDFNDNELIRNILKLLVSKGKLPKLTLSEERSLTRELKLIQHSDPGQNEEDWESPDDFDEDIHQESIFDNEDDDNKSESETADTDEGGLGQTPMSQRRKPFFGEVGMDEGHPGHLRRRRSLDQAERDQDGERRPKEDRSDSATRHRRHSSSRSRSGTKNSEDRGRRETMPGSRVETAVTSGNPDYDRLTKKMKKMMEKLSVRILRWWRKLDKKLDSLEARRANNGMTSANLVYGQCPNGFQRLDNWPSCYLLTQFNATWYEAKEYCAAFDSDLVAMGTVKEHYVLTFLIKNSPSLAAVPGWWTSGSFLGNAKQWMWTSSFYTKPFTFIKWGEGMPRDDNMQCMLLRASDDHKWHDAVCTERYNFICESNIKSY